MSATEHDVKLKSTVATVAVTQSHSEFRQQITDAAFLTHIGPIKNAIRASAFTLDEQTALLNFAKDREDEIYHAYLGRSVYPDRKRDA